MSIDVSWYDEDLHIIIIKYDGKWTITELMNTMPKIYAIIETTSERVDSIIDMRTGSILPANIISSVRLITSKAPSNWYYGVIIGASLFAENMLKTLHAIYPKIVERYRTADSIEGAVQIIMTLREEDSQ